MMRRTALFTLGVALLGCCLAVAEGAEKRRQGQATARGIAVEGIQNSTPQFSVRVSVDRKDRTYRAGELVVVTVESSRAGYLYLLYCDAEENVYAVFPNQYQKSNRIEANQKIVVPAAGSNFRFRITNPFGSEILKAIVTDEPVKAAGLPDLTKSDATQLDADTLRAAFKGMTVEGVETPSSQDETPSSQDETDADETDADETCVWAEHSIELRTLPANAEREIHKPRRFAVVIGISDYLSPGIRDLTVCHEDAKVMGALLMEKCGVAEEDCIMLLNEEATMENVRRVFCEALPKHTREGDVIFIFWSGHGGRCADEGGDEADGYDEYLPLYDSKRFEMDTMLMDDTFGRWVQDLDGRKIVVILDACHSGGQTNKAKSLSKAIGDDESSDWMPFDFVGNELSRVKDIGQEDAAIVASSVSAEVSHERLEGDLSVLTYFLVEAINNATSPITLDKLVEKVKPKVDAYVKSRFPGAKQSVFYQTDLTEPLMVNP